MNTRILNFTMGEQRTRTADLLMSTDSRNRSLLSFHIEPIVKAVIKQYISKTVGTGITLQAKPIADILKIDESQLSDWSKDVEKKFELWAKSKNLAQIQRQIVATSKILGECITFLSSPNSDGTLRVIPADNAIIDSTKIDEANSIFKGVQIDKENNITSIYLKTDRVYKQTRRRLAARGRFGKVNFILYKRNDLAGEVRGRPLFTGLHSILENFDDFLQTVVKSARMKASILGAVHTDSAFAEPADFISSRNAKINPEGLKEYELQDNIITKLDPNEKLNLFDTNRDTPQIQDFLLTVCDIIGMACGIPSSCLMAKFRSNYSASRAEILELTETMRIERQELNTQVNNIIYQQWLRQEILEKRIIAPKFFEGDVYTQLAWTNCEWLYRRQEQIDMVKEAKAYETLNNLGIMSKKTITGLYSLDFEIEQEAIKKEKENGQEEMEQEQEQEQNIDQEEIDEKEEVQDE